jgi:inner membrane protein
MDSITHIVLGGVLGEAYAGKQLGKRAIIIGALAQSLPDIDFITSFWLSPADNLVAHRGLTHSILFAILVTPLLIGLAARTHSPGLPKKKWAIFLGGEVMVHLLLDGFNAYGIGWLEPFYYHRYTFNTLFVADPLYTSWLVISFLVLLLAGMKNRSRSFWVKFGLGLSTLYLVFAITSKLMVDRDVRTMLQNQGIVYQRYFTTPTPVNSMLWFVVAEDKTGFFTGYRSVLDKAPVMDLHHFNRQDSLLKPFLDHHDVRQLIRFSENYYTVQQWSDTLVFNDLRFGQMAGWSDPRANFVFHYFLQYPDQNKLVIQRGRFARWNRQTVGELITRMKGD